MEEECETKIKRDSDITSRLGPCNMCDEKNGKYKCPRCDLVSCSLSCTRNHKAERSCSGIRDRVALIQKWDMNNFTLLSDYRFLEEIDHKLEDGRRNPASKKVVKKESAMDLPFHLKKLYMEAKKRGTLIEFMPRYFSIHQKNSTRFSFYDKKIRWHVKWIFPQADITFTEEAVDEETLLVDLLHKYMEPPYRIDDESPKISEEQCEKLAFYHSASYNRIVVLLHIVENDNRKYAEMFLSKSLKHNLANRTIVEHPTFSVVIKDHIAFYIDNDDSDDELQNILHPVDKDKLEENNESNSCPAQKIKAPRVKRKDGGLSFFNSLSDSDSIDESD